MEKLSAIHQAILKSEKQITRLHSLIGTTFAKRDKNKKSYESWQNACANFHQNYSALVFSYNCFESEEGLINLLIHNSIDGDYAREFAICFIELRPYYFRSGYLYKRLLRKLKHAPLNPDQLARYDKIKRAYRQYRVNKLFEKHGLLHAL